MFVLYNSWNIGPVPAVPVPTPMLTHYTQYTLHTVYSTHYTAYHTHACTHTHCTQTHMHAHTHTAHHAHTYTRTHTAHRTPTLHTHTHYTLTKIHTLHILTMQHSQTVKASVCWLKGRFDVCYSGIVILPPFYPAVKREACWLGHTAVTSMGACSA